MSVESDNSTPFGPQAKQEAVLLLALLATKTLDSLTTIYGLTAMDGVHEMNPVARSVFDSLGIVGGAVIFQFVIVAVFVGLAQAMKYASPTEELRRLSPPAVYGAASAVFAFVVLSNLSLIFFRTPLASFLSGFFDFITTLL